MQHMKYTQNTKPFSSQMGGAPFFSPQPDSRLHYTTTVHHKVSLFMSQLLPTLPARINKRMAGLKM